MISADTLPVTASHEVIELGVHDTCGGDVVLLTTALGGFRFCQGCAARGPEARLASENGDVEMVESVL